MKRLLLAALLSAVPSLAHAQANTNDHITPLGYCQITGVVAATLVSTCSGGIPARTVWGVVCSTVAIRWRDDPTGTAPTAAVGMPYPAGCFYYSGTFSALSIIPQAGTAEINIMFYSATPKT